ncbi:MAG: phosphoglycerate dehydrogenase [Chloroflexi bacterium]|nr:phosphoglycerate dehydrogenase [Chloroflexota bacterium]
MPFNILVTDHLHAAGWDLLRQDDDVITSGPFKTRDALLLAISKADAIIIRSGTKVDMQLLDAAPRLKVIARAGARLDNVDIDAATHRGIMVINAADTNVPAVAEHTFAMLLALARDISAGHLALQRGEWPRHKIEGFLLSGKILGIVGFGRLGRAVASYAQAFKMHVLVYDPYIDLSFAREQGVEVVNFSELLARSDIVSLHTTHSSHTNALMDTDAFASMKPNSYLLNCTHAGLVDEAALLNALDSGHLAGAAVDTFCQEPPAIDHPLTCHPKVLATPHLSENTAESQHLTSIQVVSSTLAALRGEDYCHIINLPFTQDLCYQDVEPYIHLASKLGKLQGQLAEGWITRIEVELLGGGLSDLVRQVTAVLLTGLLRPVEGSQVNWISSPVLAHEQGIVTAQVKGLIDLADYPNLIACKIYWEGGQRTVAGVLFGNGDARLVQYDQFEVDAFPDGYVLILENDDIPGVIGRVGTLLGSASINVAQWRYGRDRPGGRAVSFINVDNRISPSTCSLIEQDSGVRRARLVHL